MTKIYQRMFDAESGDSLALVAKHIPPQSKVLDIGCGAGDLGQYLREEKQCYVVGLEYSEDSIAVAKDKLDVVKAIDLNQQMLGEVVDETFDVIVMADILEHIYTPDNVVQAAEKLLKPDGKCLISIPNAGYVGALISLYDDTWAYREEGILDRTHIRFYTQKSVMNLLTDNGFDGVICDRVIKDLTESEFTQRIDSQADAVRDWLLAKPEGATYQFIVEARPKTQHYDFPPAASEPPMSFQHIVKLFWQDTLDKPFTDEQLGIARGTMGKNGVLSFTLDTEKLAMLRLDFADRRGAYHVGRINVFDEDKLLWSSNTDNYSLRAEACLAEQQLPTTCLAHHDNAFLLIELGQAVTGKNLRVETTLHAPLDEMNTAFVDSVPLANYEKIQAEKTHVAVEYSAFRKEAEGYIQTLETELSNKQQTIEAQSVAFNQLQDDNRQLNARLLELLSSSSWKLTAPLRKITRLFK